MLLLNSSDEKFADDFSNGFALKTNLQGEKIRDEFFTGDWFEQAQALFF